MLNLSKSGSCLFCVNAVLFVDNKFRLLVARFCSLLIFYKLPTTSSFIDYLSFLSCSVTFPLRSLNSFSDRQVHKLIFNIYV